jgi:hypothetical protein
MTTTKRPPKRDSRQLPASDPADSRRTSAVGSGRDDTSGVTLKDGAISTAHDPGTEYIRFRSSHTDQPTVPSTAALRKVAGAILAALPSDELPPTSSMDSGLLTGPDAKRIGQR